jgi:Tfp pilus assembly protein PilF
MTMDGRWKLAIAGSVLLSGVVGCTTTKSGPTLPTSEPISTSKNSVYIPEPEDDGETKDGPLSAKTQILFANMWIEAIAKDPNKPAAERELLLSKARRVYQDVLAHEPKNVDALLGLGQMYQITGETEKLREIEHKAPTLHPTNPKVWAWVAKRQAMASNWTAAAESFHRAVKLDPENRTYRIHLGFTLAGGKRYTESYEWLSRSMREAEAHYAVAQMMIRNGDIEKARIELRLSLQADPNFHVASEQLASLANGVTKTAPPLPSSGTELQTVPSVEPQVPATNTVMPPTRHVETATNPRIEAIPPIRVGGQ